MRITVYAGSALGNQAIYQEAAAAFAKQLVAEGHEIVYGGGAAGLMGVVADSALAAGGRVTGVIPKHLVDAEVAHQGLTELHIVDTMHQRKQIMADLADAFVALPGGVGTVEEILEAWAWLILGRHGKPMALLNVDGYWDRLLRMICRMSASGFLREQELGTLASVGDANEFLDLVSQWEPPPPRWG
ncbi:TIGR00730 family Rossman fold protein [Streptomyces sp. NBC_01724]|uniref:LOG family protein n=1 Tax=Streptomyces TaxID=1883 RepID=UPI002E31ACAD|nr:TIGR00730 family Rossman fold protein [Streptomyces sp. NBC_01724]WTE51875.1 TIGR00730 family Rossman fold protein [Streptomyces sp. NBC_01620]WTI87387.1 TIGR00730 family Rossman fold protein [Streptomyces sp. NBC_00724]